MNRQQRYYIVISSVFGLLGLALLGGIIWGFGRLSDTQATIAEIKVRTSKATEEESNLKFLKRNYEKITPDIERINAALPEDKNSSALVADLNALANQNGLKLTSIQSVTFGKKVVKTADPSLLQTIKGKYTHEIPMEIKVEGSFSGLNNFIKSVENYQRLVSISSIEIGKITKENSPTDNIEAKLKITAYLKK